MCARRSASTLGSCLILLPLASAALGQTVATSPAPPSGETPTQAAIKLVGQDEKRSAQLDEKISTATKADRWDEAIAAARDLLDLRTRVQGPQHFATVNARWTVKTLQKTASLSKSDRLALQSAAEMHKRSEALYQEGKYAESVALSKNAVAIRHRLLGEDHPDTVNSYNGLAEGLASQGKYPEAGPLYKGVLEINRRLLGEGHPDTALSYGNLAVYLHLQGKFKAAQPLCDKALEIDLRVWGEDHLNTANSYTNLAFNLNGQAKYADAHRLYEKALTLYRHLVGENDSRHCLRLQLSGDQSETPGKVSGSADQL